MIHAIKNQDGKHIIDEDIRKEIKFCLDKALDYTFFNKVRIDIVSDYRKDSERTTVVRVEY